MNNICLCVLGMHRSGTSALSGTLEAAGVEFGLNLQPANSKENAKGYWEHREIMAIHDQLLQSFGMTWDDVRRLPDLWWKQERIEPYREKIVRVLERDFASSPLWGLKDPRICRFMPLWLDIFEEVGCDPRFVIIFRHPLEVAKSLHRRRESFAHVKSAFLWLEHNVSAEFWSRGKPRAFLSFDELIQEPAASVDRIFTATGCSYPPSAAAGNRVSAIVEENLRHHSAQEKGTENPFSTLTLLVDDCYRALQSSTKDDGSADARREFDEVREALDGLTAGFGEITASHIADLQAQVFRLQQTNPIWWMRTAILRRLHDRAVMREARSRSRRSA